VKNASIFLLALGLFTVVLTASAQPSRSQVVREQREMLRAGKYDSLQKFANAMSRQTEAMGEAYPDSFYFCEAFQTPLSTKTGDLAWAEHHADLEKWIAKYPNSLYPRVALARSLCTYAWEARGGGNADTVTREGWKLFRERLAKADQVLTEAEKVNASEVVLYHVWATVGLGQHWPADKYEINFQKGIKADPNFLPIYYAKVVYLLPRWHGKPGDVERFAEEAADQRGGEDGDMLYMFIVRRLAEADGKANVFDYAEISWPRMKRGFEARIKSPRNRNLEMNHYCYFACLKNEHSTAKRLFEEIGSQWRKEAWGNQGVFEQWRKWAGH